MAAVLAAATVHFPYMTAWPERASPEHRRAVDEGFAALAAAFTEAGVDTMLVVTSEHIVNLQPRMAPPFVIGIGAEHPAFPEPQFQLAPVTRPGDPELAIALVHDLYRHGFDPAHSSDIRLDHGTTLPLQQLGIDSTVRIVPLIINSLFAPMPTLSRCRALGEALAGAIARCGGARRIGLLATGGLSHTVGAPGPERIDARFDAAFLDALQVGDLDRACAYDDAALDACGNGTHEVRNWITVASAMGAARRPSAISRLDFVPGWHSGFHQLLWAAA